MKRLANNRDLYDYLNWLASELSHRGADDLSLHVAAAAAKAGCLMTEFIGESFLTLQRVQRDGVAVLSASEMSDLNDVVRQVELALNRRF